MTQKYSALVTKDSSVNVWGLDIVMRAVLLNAHAIWRAHGEELVITSARDGLHSPSSLHYFGLAVDLRTNYFQDDVVWSVSRTLQRHLGDDFDVVVHPTHIHVEYDPKGGDKRV